MRQYAKSRGSGATSFMEADWVATNHAFYYVQFNAGTRYRWPWEDIAQISCDGTGLLGCTKRLTIQAGGEIIELSVGKRAAQSLLDIAAARIREDS